METEDNQTILYQGEDQDHDKIQIVGYDNGAVVLRVWNEDERTSYGVILDGEMMDNIIGTLMAVRVVLDILEKEPAEDAL